jgi:Carboxypeptidase regulatory-like domain
MKRRTIFSVAVVFVLFAAVAEAATVRGKVQKPDGKANSGAAVVLENAAIGATATVYTAEDGVFCLRNVPPGNYNMKVKTAHASKMLPVSVALQPTVDLAVVRMP